MTKYTLKVNLFYTRGNAPKRKRDGVAHFRYFVPEHWAIQQDDSVAKRTLSVREVWGSIPGPVKLHSVANDSPPLQRFFGAVMPRREAAEMSSATRYTLRHNTASIMKILI